MLRKIPIRFPRNLVFKHRALALFILTVIMLVIIWFPFSSFAKFLLVLLYLIAMPGIVYLYFSGYSDSFKKIVYIFFVLVFAHVCLGANAAYINRNIYREKQKMLKAYRLTFISEEDGIPFFDKPYEYNGINVCYIDFSHGKVLDCSAREGKPEFLCGKIYEDMEGYDLSFTVTYYPENIQSTSKFAIAFKLVDKEGKEPGWITYVLYGTTDHYMTVNQKNIEGKIFITRIINPREKEWKTLKVDSIIDDYNFFAPRLGGKLWDELNVEKIRIGINSWSAQGGTMSVYLKGLEVKKKKRPN